jgi:peptidyl-prolyl cis-trans isomerase C
VKRLLSEPLLHFLLIGVGLFAISDYFGKNHAAPSSKREIRLSLAELSQLALQFQSQWRRPPTVQEIDHLVENRIEEEILYREALAMGFDKDDEIVKRRMAQKMKFLAEDVAAAHEPTIDELKSWFEENKTKFAMPPRLSFRHLYFSPDKRSNRARDDAQQALTQLAGQPEDTKVVEGIADPFMFQDYYRDRAPDYLGKEFGPRFAVAVEKLTPGSWQGPIESGFGWHLVFVDSVIPGRVPDFEEIEGDVKTAWLGEQKALAWDKAYKEMRAKYTVLLPKPPEGTDTTPPTQAAAQQAAAKSRTPKTP